MPAVDMRDLLGLVPSLRTQTEEARRAGVSLEEARATMQRVATDLQLVADPFVDIVDDVYGVAEPARALAGLRFALEPNPGAVDNPEAEPRRVVALAEVQSCR